MRCTLKIMNFHTIFNAARCTINRLIPTNLQAWIIYLPIHILAGKKEPIF